MIFVGFVYLKGNSKENKYFIAYFTLILHKTNPSACFEASLQNSCRRFLYLNRRISLYNLRLP